MASYEYQITTIIRHAWRVPGAAYGGHGAAIAELQEAVHAAKNTYVELHGSEPFHDDWLRVYAADDEVVLFFETDAPAHTRDPFAERNGSHA